MWSEAVKILKPLILIKLFDAHKMVKNQTNMNE